MSVARGKNGLLGDRVARGLLDLEEGVLGVDAFLTMCVGILGATLAYRSLAPCGVLRAIGVEEFVGVCKAVGV